MNDELKRVDSYFIIPRSAKPCSAALSSQISCASRSVIMRFLQILFTGIVVFSIGCNVQQDRLEALKVAERVHAQLQSRDYAAVHKEAGESFRAVGDESKFVAGMRLMYEENGSLKTATPIAYQSGLDSTVGRIHTLIFNLEFERGRARERLVLVRSTTGPMQLWDLRIDPIP